MVAKAANASGKAAEAGQLEISHVYKSFALPDDDRMPVVEDMTFDVAAGDFVSIVGPSGCGKSTLLYCLAGLLEWDRGDIRLDGEPVTGPGSDKGLVFQNPELFAWMTVEDNIAFGLKAQKKYKQHKGDVARYIDMIGLTGFEKSYPRQLSGGMAQRVSLARALINHPKVLMLDEPFGALDTFTRHTMQILLRRIWQEQAMTMIMVTHDINEAIFLSSNIIVVSSRPTSVKAIIRNDCAGVRGDTAEVRAVHQRVADALGMEVAQW